MVVMHPIVTVYLDTVPTHSAARPVMWHCHIVSIIIGVFAGLFVGSQQRLWVVVAIGKVVRQWNG